MIDKNKREKDCLLEMARRQELDRNCFALPEKNIDTYFLERKDDAYLKEYGFETVPQLRELLQKEVGFDEKQEELLKMITVAAFKNQVQRDKDMDKKEDTAVRAEAKEVLPAFIYNM